MCQYIAIETSFEFLMGLPLIMLYPAYAVYRPNNKCDILKYYLVHYCHSHCSIKLLIIATAVIVYIERVHIDLSTRQSIRSNYEDHNNSVTWNCLTARVRDLKRYSFVI